LSRASAFLARIETNGRNRGNPHLLGDCFGRGVKAPLPRHDIQEWDELGTITAWLLILAESVF
jgi:hypothetical protein